MSRSWNSSCVYPLSIRESNIFSVIEDTCKNLNNLIKLILGLIYFNNIKDGDEEVRIIVNMLCVES